MSRPKRRFTTPLGSGAAPSLGSADPRLRRDRAARSALVPDPIASSADVEALEERLVALEGVSSSGSATTGTTVVTEEEATWQFDLSGGTPDYAYASYGTDAAWEAQRWDATTLDSITGSGTKPLSLNDFQNLSWPVPAP